MNDRVSPGDIEVHYGSDGQSQAVYVRGELMHANDYGAEEKVFDLLGVEVVHDSSFMLGQTRWSGAAKTLHEIGEFDRDRATRAAKAAELQRQADALTAQAAALLQGRR